MGTRVSIEDVRTAFNLYVEEIERNGVQIKDPQLVEGSKMSGNSFKALHGNGSSMPGTGFAGFLGWTKREAFDRLMAMRNALQEVRYMREQF